MNKVIRVKRTLWDELHTCAGLAPSPSVLNVCVVWLIALLYTRSPPHSSLSRCFECDWNLRECGTIEKSVREEERFLDNWHHLFIGFVMKISLSCQFLSGVSGCDRKTQAVHWFPYGTAECCEWSCLCLLLTQICS